MELKTRYNNNNAVFKHNNIVYLFSYNSKIAEYNIKTDHLILFKKWDFSVTTLRYLYRFINYYFYDLSTANNKKALIHEMIKNKKIKLCEA